MKRWVYFIYGFAVLLIFTFVNLGATGDSSGSRNWSSGSSSSGGWSSGGFHK